MDSPSPTRAIDGKDASGVSRSGRVRKKSSKLTEFDSPEELDSPTKVKKKMERLQPSPVKMDEEESDFSDDEEEEEEEEDLEDLDIDVKDEPLEEDEWNDNEDDFMDDIKDEEDNDNDNDNDNLQIDDDSNDAALRDVANYTQANSVYLSEKLAKKNVMIKDGQVIHRKKAQRKDKGKSRFTAYMLWAREVRQDIIDANPNMDFSAVNKRLGEMWALVPTAQKYNWKRRAKRQAAKSNHEKSTMISTGKPYKQTNLINKGGVKQPVSRPTKQDNQITQSQTINKITNQTPKTSRSAQSTSNEMSPTAAYKVNGCTPIDVAAHLKLLGESLNNIGQKLKEHEGQIAVSGSLSVLLDSMLCVLGPLACLTNQVEELKEAVPEPTLTTILDNIAYIMPGIV